MVTVVVIEEHAGGTVKGFVAAVTLHTESAEDDTTVLGGGQGKDRSHTAHGGLQLPFMRIKTFLVQRHHTLSKQLCVLLAGKVSPLMLIGGAGLAAHLLGHLLDLLKAHGIDVTAKVHMNIAENAGPCTVGDGIEHRTGLDKSLLLRLLLHSSRLLLFQLLYLLFLHRRTDALLLSNLRHHTVERVTVGLIGHKPGKLTHTAIREILQLLELAMQILIVEHRLEDVLEIVLHGVTLQGRAVAKPKLQEVIGQGILTPFKGECLSDNGVVMLQGTAGGSILLGNLGQERVETVESHHALTETLGGSITYETELSCGRILLHVRLDFKGHLSLIVLRHLQGLGLVEGDDVAVGTLSIGLDRIDNLCHLTYTVIFNLIYGLVIRGVTLQELLDGAAFTTGDGVDVHGNTLDIQPTPILIIQYIKERVFTEVTLILQQHVEVTVLIIVTLDTAADNLHIHDAHIGVHAIKDTLEMLPYIFQHLIGGVALQTGDLLREVHRLKVHNLSKVAVLELKTFGKRNELVILVIHHRGEALQGGHMALLRDGTGQTQHNTLTQRFNAGFGGVAAMHHIVNDNRHTFDTLPLRQLTNHTDAKLIGRDRLTGGFLHVILTLAFHTHQHVSHGNMTALADGIGKSQRMGGIALMAGGRHKHHTGTDIGSHEVSGLADGLGVRLILDVTGKAVQLTTVAVHAHKRSDTIAHILVQGLPEQVAGLIHIALSNGIGIRLITLFQPALDLADGADLTGEVIQNLVGDILLAHIMYVQGIADMLPEVLNSLRDILEDITPLTLIAVIPLGHTL